MLIFIIILLHLPLIISKISQTWSNRLGITLTPISNGIWSADRPFIWNNIDVGGRSVIARLSDEKKSLVVHSPVEWDEELAYSIKNLGGEIKYIISPSFEHLKYAKQWSMKYPNAIMIGCPGIKDKIPSLNWKELYDDEDNIEFNLKEDGIDCVWLNCESFLNKPFFNEVVFYHISSNTYITADSYWNYPENDLPNYSYGEDSMSLDVHECSKVISSKDIPSTLPRVQIPLSTKLWKFGMDRIYKPFYGNIMVGNNELSLKRKNYLKAVNTILDWNTEIIAPCHGDVVRGRNLCTRVLTEHYQQM